LTQNPKVKIGKVFASDLRKSRIHPTVKKRTRLRSARGAPPFIPFRRSRALDRSVSLAASTMQIQFLDHLIKGAPADCRAGYFSFKEAVPSLKISYM
jgi:hypothetical protein